DLSAMEIMPSTLQISEKEKALLLELLQRHLPGVSVWAYGSRVGGKSSPWSDLDLVVFASAEQSRRVYDLRESLEESDLPFRWIFSSGTNYPNLSKKTSNLFTPCWSSGRA
ncbi:MAG: nucleotidyltransferase domain-containing protein, partial [Verrucomicrobia bacterium]|nr:nucleotidyltransferase domain-containing protein [Verrucomicrobiota bacterium]